jgi:hypothetical protein
MSKPIIVIIGADKGGVGKTTVARAFLDFLRATGVKFRAFDTENEVEGGVLRRFFPDATEVVDITDSDGQMRVFDTLDDAVTVIDIRAGLLSPTLKMLSEIGFLDPARFSIAVLHVLGNNQASLDEVAPVAERLAGLRHVIVGNRVNATKFDFPPGALDVPMLAPKAAEAVDKTNVPFSVFRKAPRLETGAESPVLGGVVGHWLDRVHAQFAGIKLP